MEFCPNCGTRLVQKRKKKGVVLVCPKCNYEKKARSILPVAKSVRSETEDQIVIIDKEAQNLQTLPTVKIECPKCGNNQAYVWQVQTRGADESSTQFFRCTKCGYTFREYS
ncbi:transcription factor S [Candidatus Bathyarchaeota archaeon]|nr:transcription factor S [Candidatus Bathyarchaeota archaeon]